MCCFWKKLSLCDFNGDFCIVHSTDTQIGMARTRIRPGKFGAFMAHQANVNHLVKKASLILNKSSSHLCFTQWSTSWVWKTIHQYCWTPAHSFCLLLGNHVSSLSVVGMKVNTSSQRQALPRLPRPGSRKVCVAATPPRPARICWRDEETSSVDHDRHKVPNIYKGMLRW